MEFDPTMLTQGAERFQAMANAIIAKATLLGGLLGAAAGAGLMGAHLDPLKGLPPAAVVAVPALLGAAVGFSQGKEKAFWIRLQVHQILAISKIEEQTRAPK